METLMGELEAPVNETEQEKQEIIERLKKKISKFEKEANTVLHANQQLGVYYKMIAVRYMDLKMYRLSMESFDEAASIYPENPKILYSLGVSCARLGINQDTYEEKRALLSRAELNYKRASVLDPLWIDPIYALAVLYSFELNRKNEADQLLERLIKIEPEHIPSLFMLGKSYAEKGQLEKAVSFYERIENSAELESDRETAEKTRRTLLEVIRE